MSRGQAKRLGGPVLAAVGLALALGAPAASAAPTWRLEQPDPPAGSRFSVPLGRPGDLQCYAVDRCLMAVEGNATIAQGLYFYDGVSWRSYTTVCGGPAATTRIAWAGPDEFWVVTVPSPPRRGGGLSLCHVKGGQVVGSFSTPNESPDPFRTMSSAVCRTPDDCWFGGVGSRDASGQRVGAFHLHWDGTTLTTVYGPQGRGVSDMVAADGRLYESTFAGIASEERSTEPSLAQPEASGPQTIHTLTGTTFRNAPFVARPRPDVPQEGTELLGADAAGDELWFAGGGAASGLQSPADGSQPRPPIAVRRNGSFYTEVPFDEALFGDTDRFVDLAVVPGQPAAWVASQAFGERGSTTAKATVARLGADGQAEVDRLPLSGAGRGSAAKIECPAPEECWMVTTAGWLFHLVDGEPNRAANADPAFANRIEFRPNESAAQFVPDTPPADDSQLFAPPPSELPAAAAPAAQTVAAKPTPALIYNVSKPKVSKGLVLTMKLTLRRTGRVQLQARRKGKVVARSSSKVMKPGRKTIRIKLTRKRYPDALRFLTAERNGKLSSGVRAPAPGDASGTDSTTTPGDTTTTTGPGDTTTTTPDETTTTTGPDNATIETRRAR